MEAIPGVSSASASKYPLIAESATIDSIKAEDGSEVQVYVNRVSPGFFSTMQIPLRLGRVFTWRDDANAPLVAVINETLARRLFQDQPPLGQRFGWGPEEPKRLEVVGIAKDAKYSRLQGEPPETIYIPYMQALGSLGAMSFELRTAGSPTALAPAVRAALREIDPDLPVTNLKTQAEQIDETILKERVFAVLSSAFGVLALLLAAIGLYGVLSFVVAQRTREIGIRIALGASRGEVATMVMRQTALVLVPGMAAGIAMALAGAKLIAVQLYGLKANDAATIAAAAAILCAVALVAGFVPARRAAALDPVAALREE